ncbi:MAG: ribonuclease HII [Puniceicoccaceae bacterium]
MNKNLWHFDRRRIADRPGIVGVDEAGRGCLAGPVFAAAVFLPARFFGTSLRSLKAPRIDDSKQLSPDERCVAEAFVRGCAAGGRLLFAIGEADVGEIETHNILGATVLAMARALEGLNLALPKGIRPAARADRPGPPPGPVVLIDGPPLKRLEYTHDGLVGGDRASLSIALASILAKTGRDRWMEEADLRHPGYGWSRNRGYGTAEHRARILEAGPTPLHRKLFLRKIAGGPAPL